MESFEKTENYHWVFWNPSVLYTTPTTVPVLVFQLGFSLPDYADKKDKK